MNFTELNEGKDLHVIATDLVEAHTREKISDQTQVILYVLASFKEARQLHIETVVAQLVVALLLAAQHVDLKWILTATMIVPCVRWMACFFMVGHWEKRAIYRLKEEGHIRCD
jgi:hypothetical protein